MGKDIEQNKTIFVNTKDVKIKELFFEIKSIIRNLFLKYKFSSSLVLLVIFLVSGIIMPKLFEYLKLNFLNFIVLNDKSPKENLNQKLSNIITLIGFSFAILSLTISNILEKEKNAKIYFQETFTLNIIYFTLQFSISILIINLWYIDLQILTDIAITVNYLTILIIGSFCYIIYEFLNYLNDDHILKIRQKRLLNLFNQVLVKDKMIENFVNQSTSNSKFVLNINRPRMTNLEPLREELQYFKRKIEDSLKSNQFDVFYIYHDLILNVFHKYILKNSDEYGFDKITSEMKNWILNCKTLEKVNENIKKWESLEIGLNQIKGYMPKLDNDYKLI